MADEIDIAQERMERQAALNVLPPYELPAGEPGDCRICGEESLRLVNGACAPCREQDDRKRTLNGGW